MKPTSPLKTISILCFSQLLLCSLAFAREPESRGHGNEQEHHQSGHHDSTSASPRLTPTATPSPNPRANNFRARLVNSAGTRYPKGQVARKAEFRRGVLQQDRFSASVDIAIPSTTPAVATLADADTLDVQLEFSRAGVPYARCQLGLDEIRENRTLVKAEYKVDIQTRVRRGTVSQRIRNGSCDTNLDIPGNENTIPEVQAGDTATVSSQGVVFLTGQF